MAGPIVFDGGILAGGPLTGVGRAFLHTLAAYADDAAALLLVPPGRDVIDLPAKVERLATPAVCGPLRRQVELPRLLARLGAALLHVPYAAIPLRAPCPVVATVHDLPWRAQPPLRERGALRHRLAVQAAARRAAAIVVPSAATAADLARELGRSSRLRIEVVPHGVPLPQGGVPVEERRGPFVVLGADRPRKNLARLRAAHALARAQRPGLPELEMLGPPRQYVSEEVKHDRLRAARALLQVSLHEGFGLPLVEAFGHGTPVLCSSIPSLVEVAGGAALHVDPRDVGAIADALLRIDADTTLRAGLAAAGRARALELTPARSAAGWARLHAELSLGC